MRFTISFILFLFTYFTTFAQNEASNLSLQIQGGILFDFSEQSTQFSANYLNIGGIITKEERETGFDLEAYIHPYSELAIRRLINVDTLLRDVVFDTLGTYDVTRSHIQLSFFRGKDVLKKPNTKLVLAPMGNLFYQHSNAEPLNTNIYQTQTNHAGLGLGIHTYAVHSPSAFQKKLSFIAGIRFTFAEFGWIHTKNHNPSIDPSLNSHGHWDLNFIRREIPLTIGLRYRL